MGSNLNDDSTDVQLSSAPSCAILGPFSVNRSRLCKGGAQVQKVCVPFRVHDHPTTIRQSDAHNGDFAWRVRPFGIRGTE